MHDFELSMLPQTWGNFDFLAMVILPVITLYYFIFWLIMTHFSVH